MDLALEIRRPEIGKDGEVKRAFIRQFIDMPMPITSVIYEAVLRVYSRDLGSCATVVCRSEEGHNREVVGESPRD